MVPQDGGPAWIHFIEGTSVINSEAIGSTKEGNYRDPEKIGGQDPVTAPWTVITPRAKREPLTLNPESHLKETIRSGLLVAGRDVLWMTESSPGMWEEEEEIRNVRTNTFLTHDPTSRPRPDHCRMEVRDTFSLWAPNFPRLLTKRTGNWLTIESFGAKERSIDRREAPPGTFGTPQRKNTTPAKKPWEGHVQTTPSCHKTQRWIGLPF